MIIKNNYEQNLLRCASIIDTTLNTEKKITQLALSVIQDQEDKDCFKLCSIINQVADKGNITITQQAKQLKDALVNLYGSRRLREILKSDKKEEAVDEEETLEEFIEELNKLVGLNKVKSKVNDLIDYQKVQHLRKEVGLSVPKNTLHLAFTGNPGTGKTTVARIVGRIYKHIGLLSKGHFLEVSRT